MKGSRNKAAKKTTTTKKSTSMATGAVSSQKLSTLSALTSVSSASFSTSNAVSKMKSIKVASSSSAAMSTKFTPVTTASKPAAPFSMLANSRFFSADAFFRPNSNRILVKKEVPAQPKTASGIIIPTSQAKSTAQRAEVIAVGPGLRNHEGQFVKTFASVGDQVLLPDFGGTELKFDNETYHLYRDDDILGVVGK